VATAARARRGVAAKLHPGVYALKVYGNLSEEMVTVLEENGRTFVLNEEE